ncbi:hypothetical protein [Vibrio parahaemolyticus]|uniref:hypothetical protein n=1 Tax=Vibrio parahaemolyticus TaxID=670 RepID=UPI003D81A671
MQTATYMQCGSCGYEDINIPVAYSRQTANGEYYYCPQCNAEIWQVEFEEEQPEIDAEKAPTDS